jgi:hypothetical protein
MSTIDARLELLPPRSIDNERMAAETISFTNADVLMTSPWPRPARSANAACASSSSLLL